MSTEIITAKGKSDSIQGLLSRPDVIARIAEVAPKYMSPERIARIFLLTFKRDSKLWKCTPLSLLAAIMRAAQSGLEPDGRLCHLIPYKDTVNLIIDYKGLIEIARRNGIVANAELVYEEDYIELKPDDGTGRFSIDHQIDPRKPRTKIIGAWSRTVRADGTGHPDYEWMAIGEIETVRSRSQAAHSGPWVTDFGEMARKTVLRRHSKRWPLCAEDRTATEDDDAPIEVTAKRVEMSEPARPVFKTRKVIDDTDDLSFDNAVSTEIQSEPETHPKMEAAPSRKLKQAKVETPTVSTTAPLETSKETLQLRLQSWVQVEMGSDFETFKKAIIDLMWVETADQWKSFSDVPDETATRLLSAHKTVGRTIEMLKAGEA